MKKIRGDGKNGQSWQMDCPTQNTGAAYRSLINCSVNNRHRKDKSKL